MSAWARPELWALLLGWAVWRLVPKAEGRQRVGAGVAVAALAWLGAGLSDRHLERVLPPWPHYLLLLAALPFVAAVVVASAKPGRARVRRLVGGTLSVQSLLVVVLLRAPMASGWHYQAAYEWLPALGVRLHLAVDGISIWLVAAIVWISTLCTAVSGVWQSDRYRHVASAALVAQGCSVLAVLSLDLVVFCLAWEAVLVALVAFVALEHRSRYTSAVLRAWTSSLPYAAMVVGVVLHVGAVHHAQAGYWSFDYLALRRVVLPEWERWICYGLVTTSVLARVGCWPFGGAVSALLLLCRPWVAPMVYVSSASIGVVAYLRLGLGLLDGPTWAAGATVAWWFLAAGILPRLFAAWRARGASQALAQVALAQLPVAIVGLTAATRSSITGAVLLTVAQSFAFAGVCLVMAGQRLPLLASARNQSVPAGAAAVFGTLCLGSLLYLPLSGGLPALVAISSGTLVSTALGVWGKGQAFTLLLVVIGAAFASYSVLRRLSPHRPRQTTEVGVPLALVTAIVVLLGLRPNVVTAHGWEAATGVVDRYVDGRVTYLGASGGASLRPRRGGPLEVGYPQDPEASSK